MGGGRAAHARGGRESGERGDFQLGTAAAERENVYVGVAGSGDGPAGGKRDFCVSGDGDGVTAGVDVDEVSRRAGGGCGGKEILSGGEAALLAVQSDVSAVGGGAGEADGAEICEASGAGGVAHQQRIRVSPERVSRRGEHAGVARVAEEKIWDAGEIKRGVGDGVLESALL